MSIMDEDLRYIADYMTSADAEGIYAKVHALDIHDYRDTPEDQRPNISQGIREDSYRLAHESIHTALKYLTQYEGFDPENELLRESAKEVMLSAARHLEKLYLNRPEHTPYRAEELYNAALAYYLAGHYPSAFVIIRGISRTGQVHPEFDLIRSLYARMFSHIKDTSLNRLHSRNYQDTSLAQSVQRGEVSESVAVDEALRNTLHKIFLLVYEFARTGVSQRIDVALNLSFIGQQIAIERRLQEWWWLFHCTRALLAEFRSGSLWTCLKPLIDKDTTGLAANYIKGAFYRKPWPVVELWSSQKHALKYIPDGQSYCLKMPTSSGKTRIAELTILDFLIKEGNEQAQKCLYVAPYRALATEIEQSFRASFTPVGVGISQLYGGYDLNPSEQLLVDEAQILIGTPEKLDALLRYSPEIADQIGLIIIDEGHIIDAGDRGLRYELFIHRLTRVYERLGVRMLFISAVMPSVDQFSRWITGRAGDEGAITSDWRPSQQMLGILSWNGVSGRVDYLYKNLERLDQDFFIHNYVTAFDPEMLRVAKCGIRKFPKKNAPKKDLIALAAIKSVSEGPTLVFASQKSHVDKVAAAIIYVASLQQKINEHIGSQKPVIPIDDNSPSKREKLRRCIRDACDLTGQDSLVVKALEYGVVIHHGDIPRSLRVQLEDLVRDRILHLVVATNTLAQGVNLPVKTILIHGLTQGMNQRLKARDFWNICGRAGRAAIETEGSIFLLADVSERGKHEPGGPYEAAVGQINSYVRMANSEQVVSALRALLEAVADQWHRQYQEFGAPEISTLCDRLAAGDETWLEPEQQRLLKILDTQCTTSEPVRHQRR